MCVFSKWSVHFRSSLTQAACSFFVLLLDSSFLFSLLILQRQPCKRTPVNEASLELLSLVCMEDIMLILRVSGSRCSSRVHYYNCQTWLRMLRTWTWNQREIFFFPWNLYSGKSREMFQMWTLKKHTGRCSAASPPCVRVCTHLDWLYYVLE